eukprot:TRINITY_DN313_c0_g1_i7.p1 TRINITY_DN313_c0_g1~~TRINITY_DN313_c0_g1_i7.p1  ORF type:complete len:434 (-),score=114.14 TRINITY_DN313_c0_g1_i7:165-1466(-)
MEDNLKMSEELEYSKDTLYIVQYFDNRFRGIEKELKVHLLLLQKLVQNSFHKRSPNKSPSVNRDSSRQSITSSPNFGSIRPVDSAKSTKHPPSINDVKIYPNKVQTEARKKCEADIKRHVPAKNPTQSKIPNIQVHERKVKPLKTGLSPASTKQASQRKEIFRAESKTPRNSHSGLDSVKGIASAAGKKKSFDTGKKGTSLDSLPGLCLDMISEFAGKEFPRFVLCNKKTLSQYAKYKVEEFSIQIELLQEECKEIREGAMGSYRTSSFKLSEAARNDYDSLKPEDWSVLLEPKLESIVSPKDVTILKLYFAFMGKDDWVLKNEDFVRQCKEFFNVNKADLKYTMEPEISFVFKEETIKKVVELLLILKSQVADINGASGFAVFDILAAVVIDALKFSQLVPGAQESEVDRITKEIAKYKKIKSALGKYVNLA